MKVVLLNDNELIEKFLSGENLAIETLVLRYQKKLFNYIYGIVNDREIAEDIFQDTFIKIINTIRSGNYNDEGKFINWAIRIAHNLSIDFFRKEKKHQTITPDDNFNIFDVLGQMDTSKEDQIVLEQINKDIRQVVELLPEDQKQVVVMRFFQEMSFKEISEETQVSINTALGRMRYALINLRKIINKKKLILSV